MPQSPVATPENGLPLPCSLLRSREALQWTPSTHSHSQAAVQASLLCPGRTACSLSSAPQQPPATAAANAFLLGPGSRHHSVLQPPGASSENQRCEEGAPLLAQGRPPPAFPRRCWWTPWKPRNVDVLTARAPRRGICLPPGSEFLSFLCSESYRRC